MFLKSHPILATAAFLALLACQPKEDTAASKTVPTQSESATTKEEIVATVNGTPIYKNQVDMVLKQQRGMPDTPEARKMIVERLAMQVLIAQEAMKKGLEKTKIAQTELEMARQSVLAQMYIEDYIEKNPVTDAQLNDEYNKLKAQSSPNQYKARHILVKTEEEAKAIIEKLQKNPKAFEAIAKAQSQDPGSKAKGGDLGWFDPQSMVPEFAEAVKKLEKGKITSTPVKSQFGYHIIMLEDVRPNTNSLPPLEQIKPALTQQIQQQALKKMLDDAKAKAKIDIVEIPAAPAAPVATEPAATDKAPATETPAHKTEDKK